MVEKERTNISVYKRVLEGAKEEGGNISEASERGIMEALKRKNLF